MWVNILEVFYWLFMFGLYSPHVVILPCKTAATCRYPYFLGGIPLIQWALHPCKYFNTGLNRDWGWGVTSYYNTLELWTGITIFPFRFSLLESVTYVGLSSDTDQAHVHIHFNSPLIWSTSGPITENRINKTVYQITIILIHQNKCVQDCSVSYIMLLWRLQL